MTTISPGELEGALTAIVDKHLLEVKAKTRTAVSAAGRAAISALEQASPKRTGEYAAGWKQTMSGDALQGYTTTVYNVRPEMTRWLEYGHGLVYFGRPTGKFIAPRPHLDAGYQAGAAELMARLG